MHFAICNELFEGWDYRRVVEFVAATGYDGLEIAPYTLAGRVEEISAGRRTEIKTVAADHGIALTGLHWLLVKPEGLHVSSPDENVRQKTVDYLRHLIDFCGDIGGKVMVFGSPKQRSIPPGSPREEGWQRARESFAACAATAQNRGGHALPRSVAGGSHQSAQHQCRGHRDGPGDQSSEHPHDA